MKKKKKKKVFTFSTLPIGQCARDTRTGPRRGGGPVGVPSLKGNWSVDGKLGVCRRVLIEQQEGMGRGRGAGRAWAGGPVKASQAAIPDRQGSTCMRNSI